MNDDINKEVGERIRRYRERLNYTREQLSEKTDLSVQFIADIERGRKGFTIATLQKLCGGLSVSADYIVMGREKLSDVQQIAAMLEMLDEKYIPLAVEHLKTFTKTVSLK